MKIILSLFFVLLHSVLSYAYNQFSFVKYQVENGLSHNTVRGAAGGAVLCAESLTAKGYLQAK